MDIHKVSNLSSNNKKSSVKVQSNNNEPISGWSPLLAALGEQLFEQEEKEKYQRNLIKEAMSIFAKEGKAENLPLAYTQVDGEKEEIPVYYGNLSFETSDKTLVDHMINVTSSKYGVTPVVLKSALNGIKQESYIAFHNNSGTKEKEIRLETTFPSSNIPVHVLGIATPTEQGNEVNIVAKYYVNIKVHFSDSGNKIIIKMQTRKKGFNSEDKNQFQTLKAFDVDKDIARTVQGFFSSGQWQKEVIKNSYLDSATATQSLDIDKLYEIKNK